MQFPVCKKKKWFFVDGISKIQWEKYWNEQTRARRCVCMWRENKLQLHDFVITFLLRVLMNLKMPRRSVIATRKASPRYFCLGIHIIKYLPDIPIKSDREYSGRFRELRDFLQGGSGVCEIVNVGGVSLRTDGWSSSIARRRQRVPASRKTKEEVVQRTD